MIICNEKLFYFNNTEGNLPGLRLTSVVKMNPPAHWPTLQFGGGMSPIGLCSGAGGAVLGNWGACWRGKLEEMSQSECSRGPEPGE